MNHHFRTILFFLLAVPAMTSCASKSSLAPAESPVRGKTIVIDPGHGGTAGTDSFRVGPSGEREEWINLRVGMMLKDMLEARGSHVLITRTEDVNVDLKARAMVAVDNHADVFLSIHHNATADRSVDFPIIYYHANASGNKASVALATDLGRRIAEALYDQPPPIIVVSDHTIFPGSGASVLRNSYGIPGVIGEASFFSNAEEEMKLKDPEYNRKEAAAYVKALEDFFSAPIPAIEDRYLGGRIPPIETLQESERMQNAAKEWRQDYEEGEKIMRQAMATATNDEQADAARKEALAHFSRSARSFPDSPVARECHVWMAKLDEQLGNADEAHLERRRVREYYVPVKE